MRYIHREVQQVCSILFVFTRMNGGPRKRRSHLYSRRTREMSGGAAEVEVGEKEEGPRLDRLQLK